uniref:MMS19 nucleotide excision repair protein n=1 Tax=Latimeria chalumnae TaxID=7897 RepID=H3BBP1_LATCH
MTIFYENRLKDHHLIIPHVLQGLKALSMSSVLQNGMAVSILKTLFREVHVQSLLQTDRYTLYTIIVNFMESRENELKSLGADFTYGFIQVMDGEKDPRNLLVAFQIARDIIQKNYALGVFVEELFEVTSCYFPIDFTPPPNDPHGITREDLIFSLRCVLAATPKFAEYVLPLLIEKLDSEVESAKVDSLQTLTACCAVYGQKELKEFLPSLWSSIRREVFQTASERIETEGLAALQALSTCISKSVVESEAEDLLETFLSSVLQDCKHHLCEPDMKLVWPSTKLLQAAAGASCRAFHKTTTTVLPLLLEQYNKHSQSSQRRTILEMLFGFIKLQERWSHEEEVPSRIIAGHSSQMLCGALTDCFCYNSFGGGIGRVGWGLLTTASARLAATFFFFFYSFFKTRGPVWNETNVGGGRKLILTDLALPGSVVLFEVGRSEPDALPAGKDLEGVCVDGSGALQRSVGDALEQATRGNQAIGKRGISFFAVSHERVSKCRTPPPPIKGSHASCLVTLLCVLTTDISKERHSQRAATLPRSILSLIVGGGGNFVTACSVPLTLALYQAYPFSAKGEVLPQLGSTVLNLICCFIPILQGELSAGPQSRLVALLMAFVCSLPKSVEIPQKTRLLERLVELSWSSPCPFTSVSAAKGFAGIVNKHPAGEPLDRVLQSTWERIESRLVEDAGKAQVFTLLLWMSKGLSLRYHPLATKLIDKLIELLADPELGSAAADGFSLLMSESPDILNQATHADIRIMYRQRFFTENISKLVGGFHSASEVLSVTPLRNCSNILSSQTPPPVSLQFEIPTLLSLLLEALSCPDPVVQLSTLSCLHPLLLEAPQVMSLHADTLVGRLLALTSNPAMKVRTASLQCLHALTRLPPHVILPYKQRVIRALAKPLDDKKRLVRKEAVTARGEWFLLGSPGR